MWTTPQIIILQLSLLPILTGSYTFIFRNTSPFGSFSSLWSHYFVLSFSFFSFILHPKYENKLWDEYNRIGFLALAVCFMFLVRLQSTERMGMWKNTIHLYPSACMKHSDTTLLGKRLSPVKTGPVKMAGTPQDIKEKHLNFEISEPRLGLTVWPNVG